VEWGFTWGNNNHSRFIIKTNWLVITKLDLVVEGLVILELKVADAMNEAFEAQLMNYLKATEIEVGMILNFGPEPKFKRMVWTNDRKRLGKVKPRIETDATDQNG